MNPLDVVNIGREAIYVTLQISGPIMAVALIVGLVIALFQALTQVQELTLTFVPKIVAIFVSIALFLPYMGNRLNALMMQLADYIAASPV